MSDCTPHERLPHQRPHADEHRWIVPEWWWRRTEPWRGRARYRVTVDHAGAQRVRDLLWDRAEELRAVLEHPGSDPSLAGRGLAVLNSGVGEPTGSGVLVALLLRLLPPPDRGHAADLLLRWYGPEFAAGAVLAASRVELIGPPGADGLDGRRLAVRRGSADASLRGVARRLRALLAVEPEDSYRDTVEVLAAARVDAPARRLAAYLAPTERAWASEALAELPPGTADRPSGTGPPSGTNWPGGTDRPGATDQPDTTSQPGATNHPDGADWTVAALYTVVDTVTAAERVAAATGRAALVADTRLLYSLAAHLGPACAPLIAAGIGSARPEMVGRAARILADFPTDAAFDLLVGRLPDRRVRGALRGAVTAFPERADRLLSAAARRADTVGAECAALLSDHLGAPVADPLEFRPWLDLTRLPAPAYADALRLCTLLAGPEHDYVDALIADLDPAERAEFGWGIFRRWRAAGCPAGEDWVWTALAKTADDATTRAVVEMIEQGAPPEVLVPALRVLVRIGTEAALGGLIRLAAVLPPDAARAEADRGVAAVAERLGLSAERLADRRVPTCGLDADGSLPLADGTRMPLLGASDGSARDLRFLPRRVLAPDLAAKVTAVERELDIVAAAQARRLERAMAEVRTWSAAEHRTVFLEHPILRRLARQLVWVVLDESGRAVADFRVTEETGTRDVEDRAVLLTDATIALAHPLHLGDRLPRWVRRFAEDRVRQPFAQLDRTVFRLTDSEAAATRLARFADRMVSTRALLRMEDAGWRRSAPADGGIQDYLFRPVGADLQVLLALDDGIDAADPMLIPEQVVASVELTAGPPRHWMHRCGDTRFATLDPITASEILRDLEILVS
ncbi:DUF4132 domain-containing protein [Nocardia takedensis]|uniref:DUF4132 domain-containing protein n=1 Tax=Nocardia takedensis TaxID=259390 RepID=UPI00031B4638|nr:DUF4132 domain-containing protein [Nocardia takedensis]